MRIDNPSCEWLYKTSEVLKNFVSWIDEKFEVEESDPEKLKYKTLWPITCFIHDRIAMEMEYLYYAINGECINFSEGRPFTLPEYLRLVFVHRPFDCVKHFIMYKVLWFEWVDPHSGCPSYPMCDEDPMGCIIEQGIDNVEWYGHRD